MSQAAMPPAVSPHDENLHLGRNWWLFVLLGLVSVFVGLVAISSAFIATLATVTVFGILLLIAGVAEVIHAIAVRNLRGFALHLLWRGFTYWWDCLCSKTRSRRRACSRC